MEIEEIKVVDKLGFIYRVNVIHNPDVGLSRAYYNEERIADRNSYAIREPFSDSDHDWEMYHERFSEWRDAAISDLQYSCKNYFDNKK